jgi:hypothetical protein
MVVGLGDHDPLWNVSGEGPRRRRLNRSLVDQLASIRLNRRRSARSSTAAGASASVNRLPNR